MKGCARHLRRKQKGLRKSLKKPLIIDLVSRVQTSRDDKTLRRWSWTLTWTVPLRHHPVFIFDLMVLTATHLQASSPSTLQEHAAETSE